jgi:2-polyprenyl-6-methoxyphenol hydroxylase-like FAD-dependent oxidoreductase
MPKIIVLGAGVCGLAAGMLLAGDGHEVTVVERDGAAAPGTAQEAWDSWSRGGVGQFRQAHFLLPAGRVILEQELPQVAAALAAAGAARVDLLSVLPPTITDRAPRPGDDRFTTLTARRPVLEQAFARCAQATPGLEVRRGVAVAGLTTSREDRQPHVTGVRLASGERLGADLVVDAMGRRSPLPRWLAQGGARPVPEQAEESGYTYYSRFFRSPGGRVPDARAPLLTALGSFSLLTLPADNHTWSVTVYLSSGDQPLKRLREPGRWTRLVAACPLHAHWLDGQPITGIVPMAGVADRRRRLAAGGQPLATGVALLADSWACTNPSQGRGISLGLRHARLLREVVRTHLDHDPAQFAAAWDKATETELTPWYDDTIAADRARVREMDAQRRGAEPPAPDPSLTTFLSAMTHDPDLFRAFLECQAGLATLADILARPGLLDRAQQLAGDVLPIPAPSRDQLLQLIG